MADLEAVYERENVRDGWRHPLPKDKDLRLGRNPAEADLTMNDGLISGWHAVVRWDGAKLAVKERPPNPNPVVNAIFYNGQPVKECVVKPKESFVIGNTWFTVHPDGDPAPVNPVDAAQAQVEQDLTRAELEQRQFDNPALALKALEQVPNVLRLATNEQGLFRQMLKVVVNAMPRADAAGVVYIPPDLPPGELRVAVVEHHARLSGPRDQLTPPGMRDAFIPSRRLVHKATTMRKSCLNIWSAAPAGGTAGGGNASEDSMTLGQVVQANTTPWALCTPFQDGSRYALYISGALPGHVNPKDAAVTRETTGYQKVAELMVGMLETTRRTQRLAKQNAMIRQSWPQRLWRFLDDPDKLEALLKPRETDITCLFCDLRGSSAAAERGEANLFDTWKRVADSLNKMSGKITDREGIVAGFQGDAAMGFWGWPAPAEAQSDTTGKITTYKQVEQAAQAALGIKKEFGSFLANMKCGLGLGHGRAIAGRLGTTDLAKVDVYGPVCNLASRLENMTKSFGVGILVNQEVADWLKIADPGRTRFLTRTLGTVRPRGMSKGFVVSELMGADEAVDWNPAMFDVWEQAVEKFTKGDWGDSWDLFTDYFAHDPAAKCLIRVMDKNNKRPPLGWTGAFVPPPPEDEAGPAANPTGSVYGGGGSRLT